MKLRFRCAYRPNCNGIVERNHRTIKRTVARAGIRPEEAVYWYNTTPRKNCDEDTVPGNLIYNYQWRARVITKDIVSVVENFEVGQMVFVKPTNAKCTSRWKKG